MPKVHSSTLPLTRGDLVVLSTDGIKNHFHEEFRLGGTVKQIAEHIVTSYWAGMDDALVLAARYLGSA
jgi:negative regulator of sigma-B (phosphoserine phosphatase)